MSKPLLIKIINSFDWLVPSLNLSGEHLLSQALKKGGFSRDDFEQALLEEIEDDLNFLTSEIQSTADLSLAGKIFARDGLTNSLISRLGMEKMFKLYPGIFQGIKIHRPKIIVGLPRTGSTLLYNLLACDPKYRPLSYHESTRPAPSIRRGEFIYDGEKKAAKDIELLHRMMPGMKVIHEVEGNRGEECIFLLQQTFCNWFEPILRYLPDFASYLETDPGQKKIQRSYQYHHKCLQYLSSRTETIRGGEFNWLLKSPIHSAQMEHLFQEYPDAEVLYLHRDPYEAVASFASLIFHSRNISTKQINKKKLGRECLHLLSTFVRRLEQFRVKNETCFIQDIYYKDLLTDPLRVVECIYSRDGTELSPDVRVAMNQFLANNRKDKHGKHYYSAREYGIDDADIDVMFQEYKAKYFPLE